ncbi:hypothetical protein RUE5091_03906 [Ruegeria denitrificans]|uniref:Uncharacterized protein n=1 Tax=Ruegeria denitrificans TaxID=1715692 RepID=A0A0N7MAT6_9RHOB|nr:hypothetical protein RUE5091_03906 [Ruegeria denitrificans]
MPRQGRLKGPATSAIVALAASFLQLEPDIQSSISKNQKADIVDFAGCRLHRNLQAGNRCQRRISGIIRFLGFRNTPAQSFTTCSGTATAPMDGNRTLPVKSSTNRPCCRWWRTELASDWRRLGSRPRASAFELHPVSDGRPEHRTLRRATGHGELENGG